MREALKGNDQKVKTEPVSIDLGLEENSSSRIEGLLGEYKLNLSEYKGHFPVAAILPAVDQIHYYANENLNLQSGNTLTWSSVAPGIVREDNTLSYESGDGGKTLILLNGTKIGFLEVGNHDLGDISPLALGEITESKIVNSKNIPHTGDWDLTENGLEISVSVLEERMLGNFDLSLSEGNIRDKILVGGKVNPFIVLEKAMQTIGTFGLKDGCTPMFKRLSFRMMEDNWEAILKENEKVSVDFKVKEISETDHNLLLFFKHADLNLFCVEVDITSMPNEKFDKMLKISKKRDDRAAKK